MDKTFWGYCHLCEEVSEIRGFERVRGMIVWQCPVCGCYNEESEADGGGECDGQSYTDDRETLRVAHGN